MARPINMNGEEPDQIGKVRVVATQAGSIQADSATLSDANYPAAADATTGGAMACRRLRSIWVSAVQADESALPNGTSVLLEVLIRDRDAPDGSRWRRMLDGAGQPITHLIDGSGFVEVPVFGRTVYLRVSDVTGSISQNVHLLAFPGEAFPL